MLLSDNSTRKCQYIYIAGHGHSGSTLLEITIGNHPDIFAMGEIEKLSLQFYRDDTTKYKGLCSCGKRPFLCNIWHDVMVDIYNNYHVDMEKSPFMFRVSDVGLEEDYGCGAVSHWFIRNYYRLARYLCYSEFPFLKYAALISQGFFESWTEHRFFVANSLRNISKASLVVDSSKDYIGMRDLYKKNNEIMKIIFLVRDPRANAWSYAKAGLDPIEATRRWVTVNLRIKRFLEKIPPDDWMLVRYEDFCADPERVCQRLCSFLNCAYHPEMLSFSKKQHTIGGNKIRYTQISTIRQDLSWKKSLSEEVVSEIKRLFGPQITQLGYDIF